MNKPLEVYGRRKIEAGRRETEDGRWEMGDGRLKLLEKEMLI